MKTKYVLNRDGSMQSVAFDGLDGMEHVSNLSNALDLLQIENPAVQFAERVKTGEYNDIPDEEYEELLSAVKCVASMWIPTGCPDTEPSERSMNAVMLVAHAIELVSSQHAEIRRLKKEIQNK